MPLEESHHGHSSQHDNCAPAARSTSARQNSPLHVAAALMGESMDLCVIRGPVSQDKMTSVTV